jgi:hypothetical protein
MFDTRETWLMHAVESFRPMFASINAPLPATIRVSVGFAYGARRENAVIMGQCWSREASDDGSNQIFISPELGDSYEVLETIIHELIHAYDNGVSAHRGVFASTALKLGLTKPMVHTPAGPELQATLILIAHDLGEYPHAALHATISPVPASAAEPDATSQAGPVKLHSGPSTQTTRYRKIVALHCGYTARVTARWIATGLPSCPHGYPMEEA